MSNTHYGTDESDADALNRRIESAVECLDQMEYALIDGNIQEQPVAVETLHQWINRVREKLGGRYSIRA